MNADARRGWACGIIYVTDFIPPVLRYLRLPIHLRNRLTWAERLLSLDVCRANIQVILNEGVELGP